jgi:hypothetical protein
MSSDVPIFSPEKAIMVFLEAAWSVDVGGFRGLR